MSSPTRKAEKCGPGQRRGTAGGSRDHGDGSSLGGGFLEIGDVNEVGFSINCHRHRVRLHADSNCKGDWSGCGRQCARRDEPREIISGSTAIVRNVYGVVNWVHSNSYRVRSYRYRTRSRTGVVTIDYRNSSTDVVSHKNLIGGDVHRQSDGLYADGNRIRNGTRGTVDHRYRTVACRAAGVIGHINRVRNGIDSHGDGFSSDINGRRRIRRPINHRHTIAGEVGNVSLVGDRVHGHAANALGHSSITIDPSRYLTVSNHEADDNEYQHPCDL